MTMSDSWISLNPLIEEPSSLPTPRLNSSAPRDVDGIVMCCSAPSTSTNWRSIHRIPSVSIRFSTDATVIFFDFAGVLAEIAIAFPPGRSHRSVRYLGRNLNIYKLFRQEIVRMAEILIENETMFGGGPRERRTFHAYDRRGRRFDGRTHDPRRTRCEDPTALERGRAEVLSGHREGNGREHQHRLKPGPETRGPRRDHGIRARLERSATRLRRPRGRRRQDPQRQAPRGPATNRERRPRHARLRCDGGMGLDRRRSTEEHAGTRRLHQAPRLDALRREHVHAGRPQRRQGGAASPRLDRTIA